MSIGKRLVNLVRSNLSSVFDKASAPDWLGHGGQRPLEELSDAELEEELRRRQVRREAAERAASHSVQDEAWEEVERAMRDDTGRFRTTGRRSASHRRAAGPAAGASSRRSGPTGSAGRDPRLAKLYAQLECPYGADVTTVRKHYRALMLKYHPDKHSKNPERQRLATELSQQLTQAYNDLRRLLGSS